MEGGEIDNKTAYVPLHPALYGEEGNYVTKL